MEEPEGDGPLRVERRFGARVDAGAAGLTAWLDGRKMGWIGHFDDVERLAEAIRRLKRLRRLHTLGASLCGIWLVAAFAESSFRRIGDWIDPPGLRFFLLSLMGLTGLVLLLVTRRAMRRAGGRDDAFAWEREGAIRGRRKET